LLEARNYLLNFKDGHEKLRAVFCWVQPSVSELQYIQLNRLTWYYNICHHHSEIYLSAADNQFSLVFTYNLALGYLLDFCHLALVVHSALYWSRWL